MDAARYLGAVSVVTLVSGCVGTMDSVYSIKGEAPAARDCEISVVEANGGRVVKTEKVSGVFAVSYTAGGPSPRPVDVTAYCDQIKVREIKGISPRNIGDTDLGKLAP